MKMIKIAMVGLVVLLSSCTEENDFEQAKLPFEYISGEYVSEMEYVNAAIEGHDITIILTTTSRGDSLWLEDQDFWTSKVRVNVDGNTFSAEGADDIYLGEVVDVSGEIFPENDSIHVEWRYLRFTGDPADDDIVTADGVIFNGITN